jgi:hypothetical protein
VPAQFHQAHTLLQAQATQLFPEPIGSQTFRDGLVWQIFLPLKKSRVV